MNFLTDTPERLYARGDVGKTTMLAGFNEDEGAVYPGYLYPSYKTSETPPPINRSEFETHISNFLRFNGYDSDIINEAVFHEYIDWTVADDRSADLFRPFVDFITDFVFICPMDKTIRAHYAAGSKIFKYFFTHDVIST